MPDPESYTVGWICAIGTEYIAAQEFLDEEHEPPESVSANDTNDYTLGRIGKHNIAIAVLPDGEYGLSSAANVATNMVHTFPNIRIGLMVGIAGGAPSSKHDIRLGDIVVSAPRDGMGGVFQYDFGKTIQNKKFQHTQFLNQTPTLLRAAVAGLQTQHKRKGHNIESAISATLKKNPRLQREYKRPAPDTDRLFKPGVIHDSSCSAESCVSDPSNLVSRRLRTEDDDNPVIHYGLIASANQLMKDALFRDRLVAEKDVLCFEMEAAGLMNHFPCLVIRGICDYSDSHKNKEWQGYAAMAAAAYTKELLGRIAPSRIEAERKIGESIAGIHEVVEKQLHVAKEQLQVQKQHNEQILSQSEDECHQIFRLTTNNVDATYEWYKDRVDERVDGTCLWFLEHEAFQRWLKQDFGPLLVTADPGGGKSVLAKYLIDHWLPQSPAIICYFFFKDQDQNTIQQALCALLHQIFSQNPSLVKHAMEAFRQNGKALANSSKLLWEILQAVMRDENTGSMVVVLDALDECNHSDCAELIKNIHRQFDQSDKGNIKYLLTCRPYEQIMIRFRHLWDGFPKIHIPGEQNLNNINQEINRVITHRLNQLAKEKSLPDKLKEYLLTKLKQTTHRTYLWVSLVFDYLEKTVFKQTQKGIDSILQSLPKGIDEAYEQILNKSGSNKEVRSALCIILAAGRPLTIPEMNIAINIDHSTKSIQELDLEDNGSFEARLRDLCGLFISIYQGNIYLLHQTAREFLLAELGPPTSITTLRWHHSISAREAHAVLAEACVLYLNLLNNSDISHAADAIRNGNTTNSEFYTLVNYSALHWGTHFREANFIDKHDISPIALQICDMNSKSYSIWFETYWKSNYGSPVNNFASILLASQFGHCATTTLLLEDGAEIELTDEEYGQTPLLWAAKNRRVATVELLADRGANLEAKDKSGQTSLILVAAAAKEGHEDTIKVLVEKGADIEATDEKYGQSALLWAAEKGHKTAVELLLKKGANIESRDGRGRTALRWAADKGHRGIVEFLLKKGADIEAKDNFGQTPLIWAARMTNVSCIKLLLENGAQIEGRDRKYGQTPLIWAAENGHRITVELLLENGADIEAMDVKYGQTPLIWAAEKGQNTTVELLLEKGANIEAKDNLCQTPLMMAAKNCHPATVKLLADNGAKMDTKNDSGQTPLVLMAGKEGYEAIVTLLLDNGVDIEERDDIYGQTPLIWAAEKGNKATVELLLEKGAEIEAKDNAGQTPLIWATKNMHLPTLELLLEKGANIEATDGSGQTPLIMAMTAKAKNDNAIELLLEKGAQVEGKDTKYGQTPLIWAVEKNRKATIKMLLEKGAQIEARESRYGQTPLIWAAEKGHRDAVELLVENGAKIEERESRYGQTALLWAAEGGHNDVVEVLLEKGAEIEARDNNGQTALMWATKNSQLPTIELLLQKGASIEVKDQSGQTPLILAAAKGGPTTTVELLIEKGADIEGVDDKYRQAPLAWAAEKGHNDMIELLLEKGAEMEAKDKNGRTALGWAIENKHEATVKLLLEKGAQR